MCARFLLNVFVCLCELIISKKKLFPPVRLTPLWSSLISGSLSLFLFFPEWKNKWAQVVITVMNDFALPFRLWSPPPSGLAAHGLFVFSKEIPCLSGGGCPWVFFFNHISLIRSSYSWPPVCELVHVVVIRRKNTLLLHVCRRAFCVCQHIYVRALWCNCTYVRGLSGWGVCVIMWCWTTL